MAQYLPMNPWQIRNPSAECRKKPEIQVIPKSKGDKRRAPALRISGFEFLSALGSRHSDFLRGFKTARRETVRNALTVLLACAMVWLTGCGSALRTEQRVIELPADDPTATLSRASQIGQALIGAGFFAEVKKHFPELTEEQFQGLFLSWNSGPVRGQERVFLLTGIRYRGPMSVSKAVADWCESIVKGAVTDAFPASTDQPPRTPQGGG